ncbi:TspO/MBR family protein [Reyranella soli]|uniref:Tryptophan-rich sensory protein n=1 Tax=Reyranella soli TaxID=1230389 RepID=A0A512NLQ0_9HYPH|nr:TspO/MBR family protein [Reyranella soli]GEP59873.1 tryptophan-rich sensory protein [Reyranella soli]
MNNPPDKRHRIISLTAFVVLALGGGMAIGFTSPADAWYAALSKPSFNPPNWIFPPVWTGLYVMIGIAGWIVWDRERRSAAMAVWWLQLCLNFAWSPLFFSAHRIDLALAVILALLVAICAFIALTARRLPVAALLFSPYGLWILFASLLNASIASLNPLP